VATVKKVGIFKKGEMCLDEILEEIRKNPQIKNAGAIGAFIGIVRGTSPKGEKVKFLEYETYRNVAIKQLGRIRNELMEKYKLIDLMFYHVVDRVEVGGDILYLVAAAEHRKEVFAALQEAMDRLKKEVAIWKKEVTDKGAYWVSEKKRK